MENPFVSLVTIHRGDVGWWWTDDKLHDMDYRIRLNDSIDKKVEEVTRKYRVGRDLKYCCQFEGVCVQGEDKASVEKAATEIATYLARFKGVRPL